MFYDGDINDLMERPESEGGNWKMKQADLKAIPCLACHDPHSNSARNACDKCHTDVSRNCELDVRTMNTSYLNTESENNIHHITCTSCHDNH